MIIDSHAHYAHGRYEGEFPFLDRQAEELAVAYSDRKDLVDRLAETGVIGWIEPSIGFENIEKQLEICGQYKDNTWIALGVHPTRCFNTAWKNRKKLTKLAQETKIVAIGETGLDYHYPREKQHRLKQKMWFRYQLKQAHELGLPLVLHIRQADEDALKILRSYAGKLHGGVVHCFSGNGQTAMEYIQMGFKIGIGGYLLWEDGRNADLIETVKNVPLSALVVETDAPYVLPDVDALCASGKQKKKLCNSSMILPLIIEKIAALRGVSCEEVEQAVFQNTVAAFRLEVGERL